jgi:hypothetical protein
MPDTSATPAPASSVQDLGSTFLGYVNSVGSFLTGNSTADVLRSAAGSLMNSAVNAAGDAIGSALGSAGKTIQQFLVQAQSIEYCWSCSAYSSLFQNLHKIITTMYKTLVEQTPALMTLSAIILMIVLVFKMAKLLASPFQQHHGGEWRQIYSYLLRIAVIYPVFLISASTAGVEDNGQFSPVTDLFISGPLALGSQLGATMAKVSCGIDSARMNRFPACQVANSQGSTGSSTSATTPGSGIGGGSTGSSSGSTTPGSGVAGPTTPGSYSALEAQHLALAQSILYSFHRIGIAGIGAGVWAATQLPSTQGTNIITRFAYLIAGVILASTYFMLTLTFGFRYVDALIRMFVVGSLLPIFLFLWIFEGTRRIAHAALKQMLFAGAAFAVAGLVVTISAYIMIAGFEQAFGAGQGSEAMFNVDFWSSQMSGQWDWMKYFYMLGCAIIVTNLSKAVFSIAGQLVETDGNSLGIGKQMEAQAGQAQSFVRSQTVGRFGF